MSGPAASALAKRSGGSRARTGGCAAAGSSASAHPVRPLLASRSPAALAPDTTAPGRALPTGRPEIRGTKARFLRDMIGDQGYCYIAANRRSRSMCGIAGLVGRRAEASEALARALDALRHRGPDDQGAYVGDGAASASGACRSSISPAAISRSRTRTARGGSSATARSTTIVSCARTWRKGHRFSTGSDTEVILHLYEEYGERCLERLRGMFAFAIWDEGRRTLFAARDHLGQKPLFYVERGSELCSPRRSRACWRSIPGSPSPTSRPCTSTWRCG